MLDVDLSTWRCPREFPQRVAIHLRLIQHAWGKKDEEGRSLISLRW